MSTLSEQLKEIQVSSLVWIVEGVVSQDIVSGLHDSLHVCI